MNPRDSKPTGGSNAAAIDVLVVGAGPVGSAVAADLARRGVSVRLIDRADAAFSGSRAKGVQPRTLEVLDDLGVIEEALAAGDEYPLMGAHIGPLTLPWRMARRRSRSPDVPYPNILLLPQFRTDAILHRLLGRLGVTVEFGQALASLDQDEHGVIATLDRGDTIRSRYLVGADGGGSAVRKAVGLRFAGETDESDQMLIADAIIDGLPRNRWHVWPRAGGRFVAACPLPHSEHFQLMIRLEPGEQPDTSAQALADQFRSLTGHPLREVTWSSVFRPNIRLVERYRAGRVFLAGDAGHVHAPTGAQGLNTGVQDAYNLGWKLGQVLAGAPDSLLDTYDGERRPVAARVLGRSTELYTGMDERRLSTMFRGDSERQLALSYRGGPLAPLDGEHTGTMQAGDRAPDGQCAGPGSERLFDAYRGPHFTLLAFGPRATRTLDRVAWPEHGAPLKRLTVADDRTAKTYGIDRDTLVLVRPDGYLAGVFADDDPAAAFGSVAGQLTPAGERALSRSR